MNVYDILLSTSLGKKQGELSTQIENGKIRGYLSLLGHTEPINGEIDENGNCTLAGKLVTLLNTIPFTASGTIRNNSLRLRINGKRGFYEMLGTLRYPNGGEHS